MKEKNFDLPRVSTILSKAFSDMVFVHGFVHADPHQGNLFIRKNESGQTQVILLDHGLYKEMNNHTRISYAHLWRAIIE